jgi:hypothetical protein
MKSAPMAAAAAQKNGITPEAVAAIIKEATQTNGTDMVMEDAHTVMQSMGMGGGRPPQSQPAQPNMMGQR